MLLILIAFFIIATIIYTIISMFAYVRARRTPLLPRAKNDTIRLLAVLGSGGHTAEMLRLVGAMDKRRYCDRHYIVAAGDRMSVERVCAQDSADAHIDTITRSRQVHQSYVTACLTTLRGFVECVWLLWRAPPADVVLTNGPGTCVPVLVAQLLLNVLAWRRARLIYVESVCRVERMSLTGRLVVPLCDRCVVQWPQLATHNTVYLGCTL